MPCSSLTGWRVVEAYSCRCCDGGARAEQALRTAWHRNVHVACTLNPPRLAPSLGRWRGVQATTGRCAGRTGTVNRAPPRRPGPRSAQVPPPASPGALLRRTAAATAGVVQRHVRSVRRISRVPQTVPIRPTECSPHSLVVQPVVSIRREGHHPVDSAGGAGTVHHGPCDRARPDHAYGGLQCSRTLRPRHDEGQVRIVGRAAPTRRVTLRTAETAAVDLSSSTERSWQRVSRPVA